MKQSRRASWIETVSSTLVGWIIAFLANVIVLPLFGYDVTYSHAFWIGVVFTFISVVRTYLWRRAFEHLRVVGILR